MTHQCVSCLSHTIADTTFFPDHWPLFSYESEARGEKSPESKFATTGYWGRTMVVLGFNVTWTAKVISWRSVMHMCFLAFSHEYLHNFSYQSHWLLFSHTSAEMRGENTQERKVPSAGDRTHNHQVMSPTCSPLSHRGQARTMQVRHTNN